MLFLVVFFVIACMLFRFIPHVDAQRFLKRFAKHLCKNITATLCYYCMFTEKRNVWTFQAFLNALKQ